VSRRGSSRAKGERRAARAVRGADDRLPEGYVGVVMEKLGPRRATMLDMKNGLGMMRMRFKIPRGACWGTGRSS